MHWTIAAPWELGPDNQWLLPHVDSDRHRFTLVGASSSPNWHQRASDVTTPGEWRELFRQGRRAVQLSEGGVITLFPQLAATASVSAMTTRGSRPLLAWSFNTELATLRRRLVASAALRKVDRFVVLSTREIDYYAEQLKLPVDRFHFVPMFQDFPLQPDAEDEREPFVFATGSGFRDYGTFFEAMGKLGYPTKVLAGPRILSGLTPPPSVEILPQLARYDIHRHMRRARVNVVPLTTAHVTAGIVTIVETFLQERALVGTDRPGVEDYLQADRNCVLYRPGDADGLAAAIEAMWCDGALRSRLNAGARSFADENCTPKVAGVALTRHLDEMAAGHS